ncbi:Flp family type IVb pilin [Frigidibacter sp.]|uniref:Flp family type IVb pilin n=1 Tax=Frigidibacter sp. TaxID=2586418 RepID=UPI002735D383|nr:pilus assembly protein [Frigidibacter sp.]MDP3338803.1 pilus assembly protein [Frigidibacter sp.]
MKLINLFKNFRNDEDGAVTVDWVVLTAAVVGLAIAAMTAINSGVGDLTTDIGTSLTNVGTNTTIAAE